MLKSIFLGIFFFIISCSFATDKFEKIDSLRVYYIPLSTSSRLSLNAQDIRGFNENYLKTKLINNANDLNEFHALYCGLQNDSNRIDLSAVDARIVIDIYSSGKDSRTITLDKFGRYSISKIVYNRLSFLIIWINNFIEELF